jgi:hypothetical protein
MTAIQDAPYCEMQRFNQPLLRAIVYIVLAVSVAVPVFAHATNQLGLVSFIAIPIAASIYVLFEIMKLYVWIDATKISYRFYPFHSRIQAVAKSDLKLVAVVTYRPVKEYGGWGLVLAG